MQQILYLYMLHLQICPLTLSEVRFPNMTTGRLPSIEGGIQPTIVDAKGDLIAATAADTPARIAVGANDTVLTADSAEATGLKWATPSSGGMTLLETLSLSGSSVTSSSIAGTYTNLFIALVEIQFSANVEFYLRLNGDTASNYAYNRLQVIGATGVVRSETATAMEVGEIGTQTTNNLRSSGNILIYRYASSNSKNIQSNLLGKYSTFSMINSFSTCNYATSSAITTVTLYPGSGTFSNGTAYIYGVK